MNCSLNAAIRSTLLAAAVGCFSAAAGAGASASPPHDLTEILKPIRDRHDAPALAAAIVTSHGLWAQGAVGVRQRGESAAVTFNDLFHLGSCTKAMTATLIARLVQSGTLRWETTVAEVFGDSIPNMHEQWQSVTLEQLLTNTAGAPANLDADGLWQRLWLHTGTPIEQRHALVEGVVTKPPQSKPGSRYIYSNAGFAIAGAMAEKVTGESWEDLMRIHLFDPLKMTTAGFGAPGSAEDSHAQPRGHSAEGKPVQPGRGADNPAAIGPAGTVHASLGDWAKFIALHLRGASGERDLLLPPETFEKLHTTPPTARGTYAMGWLVTTRDWARGEYGIGRTLTHAGSNTMWYCVTWLAPERGFAVLVACNQGGDAMAAACDQAAAALIRFYQQGNEERE